MKKILSMLLVLAMLVPALAGCGAQTKQNTKNDDDTLTILLPQKQMGGIIDVIKEKFPDINFEEEVYIGDNSSAYLSDRIVHGEAGDLIYYTVFSPLEEHTSQFYDLAGTTITSNLNDDVISMVDIDGSIYQLPGPLEMRCVSYNKTLFEEYGWEMPNNFDELVELVKQIRKDAPDITPISSAGQVAYYFSIPGQMSQAGYLSTSDGYKWEQAFFKGEVSMREGFIEGLEGTKRLIEAGAFDYEKYENEWTVDQYIVNREAAMNIQWAGVNALFTQIEESGSKDEFGLMPFYGVNESDKVIVYNSTGYWSINKKLGEKGNEKKLENAVKVLKWLSSSEGQELLRSNQGQLPVTADKMEIDPRITELLEYTQNGYKTPMMYTGYEHLLVETGNIIGEAIKTGNTENMIDDFIVLGDKLTKQYAESKDTSLYNAYMMEDLDREQTAQLIADILSDTGLGDFSLVTMTGVKNDVVNRYGAAGQIYKGGIILQDILIINASRKNSVGTLELTGEEVRTLLEQGKPRYKDECLSWEFGDPFAENPDELPQEYFEYYWSGIDVTMKDGKVTSVKLNGKELSDTETYTVVVEECDYPRAYIDEFAISELTLQDMLINYFTKQGEIYAPKVLRK